MPFENCVARAFTATSIRAHAPALSGVYGICNAREWIYIGEADDIRGRLLSHLNEIGTTLMQQQPSGFVFELRDSRERPARQGSLVIEYGPVCNRQWTRERPHVRTAHTTTSRPEERAPERNSMGYVMTGFYQEEGIRRYTFKGAATEHTSQEFFVDADVTLLRKYGIALQELPLLCRRLLEKDATGQTARVLIFSEQLMREHAEHCAAIERAAKERRKTYRRPKSARMGQAWRGPAQ